MFTYLHVLLSRLRSYWRQKPLSDRATIVVATSFILLILGSRAIGARFVFWTGVGGIVATTAIKFDSVPRSPSDYELLELYSSQGILAKAAQAMGERAAISAAALIAILSTLILSFGTQESYLLFASGGAVGAFLVRGSSHPRVFELRLTPKRKVDIAYSLMHSQSQDEYDATLREIELHGIDPAYATEWARLLQEQGESALVSGHVNSYAAIAKLVVSSLGVFLPMIVAGNYFYLRTFYMYFDVSTSEVGIDAAEMFNRSAAWLALMIGPIVAIVCLILLLQTADSRVVPGLNFRNSWRFAYRRMNRARRRTLSLAVVMAGSILFTTVAVMAISKLSSAVIGPIRQVEAGTGYVSPFSPVHVIPVRVSRLDQGVPMNEDHAYVYFGGANDVDVYYDVTARVTYRVPVGAVIREGATAS